MNKGLKFGLDIQLFATDPDKEESRIEEEGSEEEIDYVQAIQELKSNSVSKEKYEKLEAENKKMLKALIDGEQIELENGDQATTDINEKISKLHKEMFVEDFQGNDLDYCSKALELRKAVMERDGEQADIFLPKGHNVVVTEDDRKAAARVAEVMQEAIDQAQGNNQVFIALLQKEIVDDSMRPSARRR